MLMFSIFARVKINVKNCLNFFIVREAIFRLKVYERYNQIVQLQIYFN